MTEQERFYNPEKYNFIFFQNIWNMEPDPKFTGKFRPLRDVDKNFLEAIEKTREEKKHLRSLKRRYKPE